MMKPHGVLPALITPVDDAGKINESMLRKMVDFVIDGGVHGVFALGTSAEFYALSHEEIRRILEITVDQTAGRVPVYAGANCISTRECVQLVELACEAKVDAVSVLTPMFISPDNEELYEHYTTIARNSDKPVLLYNNPDKTGVNLSPTLVERLAAVPNIVGIKDSSGNMTQAIDYLGRTKGMDFSVLMGRDTLIYATLCHGGHGAVAACANVAPKLVSGIYDAMQQGDHQLALELQMRLAPLRLAFTLGTFPQVVKEALKLLGMDAGNSFAPVRPLPEEQRGRLKQVLVEIGVL